MIFFPQQQPIRFNVLDVICNCNILEYRQLANQTDITPFQVELQPCPDAIELVVNGGFTSPEPLFPWVVSGPANIFQGNLCNPPAGDFVSVRQDGIMAPGRYYQVTVDVVSAEDGGSLFILFGSESIGFVDEPGTHTFYAFMDDFNDSLTLQLRNGPICIDNVSLKEIDLNHRFLVLDEADNILDERYLPDFTTKASTDLGLDVNEINGEQFQLKRQWLTVYYNWATVGIADGCIRFGVLDSCENTKGQNRIPNGEFEWPSQQEYPSATFFDTLQPWDIQEFGGATADIDVTVDNQVDYNGSAVGSVILEQKDIIGVGVSYDFELDVSFGAGSGTVRLKYGTVNSSTFTTTGTHTGTVVSDGLDFQIIITGDVRININYVRHTFTNDTDYFVNHDSVGLNLGNHQCTVTVNACNQFDTFGFGFEGINFSPFIRLEAKLTRAQYDYDRNVARQSNGNFRVHFFDRIKRQLLRVEQQPEYVHDFLSLLAGFDHFYIDNIEYFVTPDSEYQIEYNEELDDIGSVDIEVTEKQKLVRNVACAKDFGGCALPPNILLLENGSAVLQEDGSFILITG